MIDQNVIGTNTGGKIVILEQTRHDIGGLEFALERPHEPLQGAVASGREEDVVGLFCTECLGVGCVQLDRRLAIFQLAPAKIPKNAGMTMTRPTVRRRITGMAARPCNFPIPNPGIGR